MSAKRGGKKNGDPATPSVVRCAIYCRVSVDRSLDNGAFTSIDAQREAAEAYVGSQKQKGWTALTAHYDDSGCSGGTTERPALQRLLADVRAGKVDSVVVYRLDRFSRSLLDFSKLMEVLGHHQASLVSVSEAFDTATSMGRMVMHLLATFAQFERETIAERTRDKMGAARRRGRWTGGHLPFGFDLDPAAGRLVVNNAEAERVRAIFQMYLEKHSTFEVLRELARRRWTTKRWTTRKGEERGGRAFDKSRLLYLLKNVVYIGKVRYDGVVHDGAHEAIVDADVWQRVQMLIGRNAVTSGSAFRNKHGALLGGILRCSNCDCAMTPCYTTKNNRRFRYYTCLVAQRHGWNKCPAPSIPATEIERFVVERIRAIGADPALRAEVIAQAKAASASRAAELERERLDAEREMRRIAGEIRKALGRVEGAGNGGSSATTRLAELQEQVAAVEDRARRVRDAIAALNADQMDESALVSALERFDPLWETLTPKERARAIHLLVERIAFDGGRGTIAITFRPGGIKALVEGSK